MNAERKLAADRQQLERFVSALFKHAAVGSFVSLRSFTDKGEVAGPPEISTVPVADTLSGVVEAASAAAQRAASASRKMVFAPPVCTFRDAGKASEDNVADGLVITVELDNAPATGLARLRRDFGEPTLVMASGGEWLDTEGEVHDKLHVHYRLAKPARSPDEYVTLRRCRAMACALVDADATAIPLSHPLRWAGSIHRKATPRLARIVGGEPDSETTLQDAERTLTLACELHGVVIGDSHRKTNTRLVASDLAHIERALSAIPNDDPRWDPWNDTGMATYAASDGAEEGYAAWVKWSEKSEKHDERICRERWDHYYRSPPEYIGMGTLVHRARLADPSFSLIERLPPEQEFTAVPVESNGAGVDAFGNPVATGGDEPTMLILDEEDPADTADRFKERYFSDKPLKVYADDFYQWHGMRYAEADKRKHVRAKLLTYLRSAYIATNTATERYKPNSTKVNNVMDMLGSLDDVAIDSTLLVPRWLDGREDLSATELLACTNGLLHLPSLTLHDHSPEFFNLNALDYAYQPDAPTPTAWLKFLRSIWPGDQESIDALQMLFGYLLTNDTSQHKIGLLVGPPRSGKGTIGRILTKVIGAANVCNPTLKSLGGEFGLEPLIGKQLALIADAKLSSRMDQQAIAERLLSISGEDGQDVHRKHKTALHMRLSARFVVLANSLPKIDDASGALASRFVIISMTESFRGREDRGLGGRLETELPGILNWAIAGWQMLDLQGMLLQPRSALDSVQELQDLNSPVAAFVRECCTVSLNAEVEAHTLFNAWRVWCVQEGREQAGTAATFGRDIRAAVPTLERVQRGPRTDQRRWYTGVGLRENAF